MVIIVTIYLFRVLAAEAAIVDPSAIFSRHG